MNTTVMPQPWQSALEAKGGKKERTQAFVHYTSCSWFSLLHAQNYIITAEQRGERGMERERKRW